MLSICYIKSSCHKPLIKRYSIQQLTWRAFSKKLQIKVLPSLPEIT